jgi:5,10-methylenetetrahydromethanopterin reductase
MARLELWTSSADAGIPGRAVVQARRSEDEGWDGLALPDSQNMSGDPFVAIALAAHATTTLRFATGVTNTLTRHPALMACTAASVQAESNGRFVLGIGRGDSAAAHLGMAPASVRQFDNYLRRLRGYLAGEEVPFDPAEDIHLDQQPVSALGMAGGPVGSKLRWMKPPFERVSIDVAASGPKVIRATARHADAISLAVGADLTRLRWALDELHAGLAEAGRPHDAVSVGVHVPVFVHEDRNEGRELVRGAVGSYARFSAMHRAVSGPVDDATRRTLESVHDAYDMRHHFSVGSPQSQHLTPEAIDLFAIVGPAGYCVERLQEIVELGVDRLSISARRGLRADPQVADEDRQRLVTEVLPRLR